MNLLKRNASPYGAHRAIVLCRDIDRLELEFYRLRSIEDAARALHEFDTAHEWSMLFRRQELAEKLKEALER